VIAALRAGALAAFAIASAAGASTTQAKGPIVVLDGIRLGQSVAKVRPHLGEPLQVHEFEDGWRAEAFKAEGHYVVLEVAPSDPDVIAGIQITGERNAQRHGLGALDLGDTVIDAEALLGKPKSVKDAVDDVDGKTVAGTTMHDYGDTSFESSGGRITSIKIQVGDRVKAPDFPDLPAFLATLRGGDVQDIAQVLSSDLELRGEPAWAGPILESLEGDARVRAALFGPRGVASMKDGAGDGALRMWSDDGGGTHVGYVFKFTDGPVSELLFVDGPEGWELYEVN
jgi:hypothetical protein